MSRDEQACHAKSCVQLTLLCLTSARASCGNLPPVRQIVRENLTTLHAGSSARGWPTCSCKTSTTRAPSGVGALRRLRSKTLREPLAPCWSTRRVCHATSSWTASCCLTPASRLAPVRHHLQLCSALPVMARECGNSRVYGKYDFTNTQPIA